MPVFFMLLDLSFKSELLIFIIHLPYVFNDNELEEVDIYSTRNVNNK